MKSVILALALTTFPIATQASGLTLKNNFPEGSVAEFRIFQGQYQVARIGVHAGGSAVYPSGTEYSAQAYTTMGQFSLSSNIVNFSGSRAMLTSQMLMEQGYYDFQLVQSPGTQLNAITLQNTTAAPVQFKLQRPNSPFQIVTVVDENDEQNISTAQQWQVYAIVNGITTATVEVTDPNAVITLVKSNNDEGGILMVGDGLLAKAAAASPSSYITLENNTAGKEPVHFVLRSLPDAKKAAFDLPANDRMQWATDAAANRWGVYASLGAKRTPTLETRNPNATFTASSVGGVLQLTVSDAPLNAQAKIPAFVCIMNRSVFDLELILTGAGSAGKRVISMAVSSNCEIFDDDLPEHRILVGKADRPAKTDCAREYILQRDQWLEIVTNKDDGYSCRVRTDRVAKSNFCGKNSPFCKMDGQAK